MDVSSKITFFGISVIQCFPTTPQKKVKKKNVEKFLTDANCPALTFSLKDFDYS